MRLLKSALFIIMMSLCGVLPAQAQSEHFFEALYDVPVMPGLQEIPDQAFLFDKPDGRIASVTAGGNNLKEQDISRFYGDTLPQMGWRKTADNQYVRNDDRLSLRYKSRPPATFVTLTLEPGSASRAR